MSNDPLLLEGAISPSENTKLFGHESAQTFLATAYKSGRIHHAVLLEGPEGIGKATLAFRFANHILCHSEQVDAPASIADPDPTSGVSRQIAGGASHDLVWLKRPVDEKTGKIKSAITIDEVRKAGRFFSQTNGTGNWRVVIVDAADDMNRSAANAILKILEEPPKKSIFLLISHAPGSLLPTIRSRCLPLRLNALSDKNLASALAHLNLSTGSDVISRAEGSVKRSLQLLNYGGMDIVQEFEKILKEGSVSGRKSIHSLAQALTAKDQETAFEFFKNHLNDHVSKAARQAAEAGNLMRAERQAHLTSELLESFRTAQAYNLDRKQTIISAFSALFHADAT